MYASLTVSFYNLCYLTEFHISFLDHEPRKRSQSVNWLIKKLFRFPQVLTLSC